MTHIVDYLISDFDKTKWSNSWGDMTLTQTGKLSRAYNMVELTVYCIVLAYRRH